MTEPKRKPRWLRFHIRTNKLKRWFHFHVTCRIFFHDWEWVDVYPVACKRCYRQYRKGLR